MCNFHGPTAFFVDNVHKDCVRCTDTLLQTMKKSREYRQLPSTQARPERVSLKKKLRRTAKAMRRMIV